MWMPRDASPQIDLGGNACWNAHIAIAIGDVDREVDRIHADPVERAMVFRGKIRCDIRQGIRASSVSGSARWSVCMMVALDIAIRWKVTLATGVPDACVHSLHPWASDRRPCACVHSHNAAGVPHACRHFLHPWVACGQTCVVIAALHAMTDPVRAARQGTMSVTCGQFAQKPSVERGTGRADTALRPKSYGCSAANFAGPIR